MKTTRVKPTLGMRAENIGITAIQHEEVFHAALNAQYLVGI